MKKIDKYILSEMQLPIVFGVSLFTFIFLIDLLTQIAEMLVVKSVPFLEIITLLSYYMPSILVETIPMGVFLGVMITYSSLSSTSEIAAMQASGLGINRLLRTPVILGLFITIFIYFFQENVAPIAYKKSEMLTRKIAYTRPSANIEEKRFVELGDYNLYVNEFDEGTNQPKNLVVFVKDQNSVNPTIMLAKSSQVTATEIRLEDIDMYKLDSDGRKSLYGSFEERVEPLASFYGNFKRDKDPVQSYGLSKLKEEIKRRKAEGSVYLKYEINYYRKLYFPASTIILCVLGVVLSINHARTGKGISFGISIFIIAVYMIAVNTIITFAQKETMSLGILMFVPNFILIIITFYLYIKKIRRS